MVAEGERVRVEPLAAEHEDALWQAGCDEEIWRFMPVNAAASREHFAHWLQDALRRSATGEEAAFAIVDLGSGAPIGSTRYLALRPEHRGLEIGWTWLAPAWWRTGANVETKLLLLTHAFEALGAIRVEFKTDELNERSRKSLAGLPAQFEGILRSHMIVRGDVIRDSAYYSVIASEWPAVRAALRARLEHHR
jgi:RimJ/RimL family protein N-acetyltransferase